MFIIFVVWLVPRTLKYVQGSGVMKKGVAFVLGSLVSCWFTNHCLGSTHVKDIFSGGFEVNPRSERTLVIQHRGSETKACFAKPLFAHGPKAPRPSVISSYRLPEAAPAPDYKQDPAQQSSVTSPWGCPHLVNKTHLLLAWICACLGHTDGSDRLFCWTWTLSCHL